MFPKLQRQLVAAEYDDETYNMLIELCVARNIPMMGELLAKLVGGGLCGNRVHNLGLLQYLARWPVSGDKHVDEATQSRVMALLLSVHEEEVF